jgi:hypothetical protein
MIKEITLFSAILTSLLHGGVAIVPGDEQYYKAEQGNVELIYTQQNRYAAEQAMVLELLVNKEYEHSFGYVMDTPLHIGIISQQNQVANGFSTQFPYNLQINYMGGSLQADYLASTSWLNTLLCHETAHNYQLNAKASSVTRGLHSVLGNAVMMAGFFPLFSVPNVTITSYLLEGNAVLNESWQGNGGRLYSGRFKAESVMQAKAGHITPQFLYNQTTHAFPYYDRHYIIGGFFQLYLAEKYGLAKVNGFFYNHSRSWLWPFRTNHIFRITFGESYEEAIAGYNQWLLQAAEDFVEAGGDPLVTSKYFSSLNNCCDKIYFLISDGQRAPELVRLFKKDKMLKVERKSYFQGKVINLHDEYLTQGSGFVGPTRIYQGLFDENGHIIEGTESRVIQGYGKDGAAVYFDLPSSFDQPQLYVGDDFYSQVNSSVHIDKDGNLYYFVQHEKRRTLYMNRIPLYSYEGYYGIVSDVDSRGNVYFVANSRKGSSLYRVGERGVERVSKADNVVEARLLNDEEVLIAAIGSEDYYYVINAIESREEPPYETKYFFEEDPNFSNAYRAQNKIEKGKKLTLDDAYYGPLNLHYGGSMVSFGTASKNGKSLFTYSVAASFEDPLLSNAFSLFAQSDIDEVGIAGLGYVNNAHLLEFGGTLYGVYNEGDANTYHDYNATTNEYSTFTRNIDKESRKYGFSAYLRLPVIQSGYNRGNVEFGYYQDYDNNARSPLVLSGNLSHVEQYGQSMFSNYVNAVSLFGAYDRGDRSYGFEYTLSHDLPYGFYIGMALKGVRSDYEREDSAVEDADYTRGVKFSNFQTSVFNDPSTVVMPSLEYTRFVKQAGSGELSLTKQFDGRILFFTFPFSLTREALYAKQRYYDIQDFGQADYSCDVRGGHTIYNETTAGAALEILFFNRLTLPLTFEYIYNSNTEEKHNFRFSMGGAF